MPISVFASSIEVKNPQLNNVDELIGLVLKNSSIYLGKNSDGTIFVKSAIYGIDVPSESIRDFLDSVSKLNEGVKRGIIYFDENLIPHAVDISKSHGINNPPSIMYIPDEPPTFNLMGTLHANVQELDDVLEMYLEVAKWNPGFNPYLALIGYWLGKVMEGGDWDYKRQLGWNNDYKVVINGRVDYVKGEDIGNINYGYTGRHLGFSQTTLKSAAGFVQILTTNFNPEWFDSYFDDPNDQAAIQRGIDLYDGGY